MPHRIQRKRAKGWRMPPGTIYVGRGTKWGNPHTVAECGSKEEAVARYSQDITNDPDLSARVRVIVQELGGRNLACWCPDGAPCHADVLLEIANPHPTAPDAASSCREPE